MTKPMEIRWMSEGDVDGVQGSLPPIDPTTGFLPPGIHRCTWSEFEQVFVDEAPNYDHRRRHLRALELWVGCLDDLLPGSTLWLDGGFVSHKSSAPSDIDVLAIVDDTAWAQLWNSLADELKAFQDWVLGGQGSATAPKLPNYVAYGGLLTHQDVSIQGTYYPRIQPFGGYLDSFIVPTAASEVLANFEAWWCMDFATNTPKGFVEVVPDGR